MIFDLYKGDEKVRYLLGKSGRNIVAVVGLNPSTANENEPDATIRSVQRLVGKCGPIDTCFLMVNLYPRRFTKPKDLPHPSDADALLIEENTSIVAEALQKLGVKILWAAWGNKISSREYFQKSLCQLHRVAKSRNMVWRRCGLLTKSGHPRHPLFLPSSSEFRDFDLDDYLKGFQ